MLAATLDSGSLLSVRGLSVSYQDQRGWVQALRNVSFEVSRREALAFIGESGSGKTTLGLSVMRLLPTQAIIRQGEIIYWRHPLPNAPVTNEINVLTLHPSELRRFHWQECAMVFQGALHAFNPALRISGHFVDTAQAHGYFKGRDLYERALELLTLMRLDGKRVWHSFPHELSGGMRQRALIALSLLLEPSLIILDEPMTAIDVLTQRSILDGLKDLRRRLGFSMILISHDLSLAAELAHRLATVYAGQIVEIGEKHTVFKSPRHPYTIGLINAVPRLAYRSENLASIPGSPPDLIDLPTGCKFHPRCPLADTRCRQEEPSLESVGLEHQVACWHWQRAEKELGRSQVYTT